MRSDVYCWSFLILPGTHVGHPTLMQPRVTIEEPMPASPHVVSPLMMVTVARISGEAPAAVARR